MAQKDGMVTMTAEELTQIYEKSNAIHAAQDRVINSLEETIRTLRTHNLMLCAALKGAVLDGGLRDDQTQIFADLCEIVGLPLTEYERIKLNSMYNN